jgi:hypothetical protein
MEMRGCEVCLDRHEGAFAFIGVNLVDQCWGFGAGSNLNMFSCTWRYACR